MNYLCAGYKHFFRHIDPYMRFMANELKYDRAPARVMEWARLFNPQPSPNLTRTNANAFSTA